MNTHSAVDLCVSIMAASPLLASWYAIMAIVVISVETLNMEKNAVFHAGDTLQMDSRPPPAHRCRQWGQKWLSRLKSARVSIMGFSIAPRRGRGGCVCMSAATRRSSAAARRTARRSPPPSRGARSKPARRRRTRRALLRALLRAPPRVPSRALPCAGAL